MLSSTAMTRPRSLVLPLLLSTALLAASPARAQPALGEHGGRAHLTTAAGTAIQAGAGITRFTDSDPRAVGGNGLTWELRAAFGTRRFIGSELAYVGSARGLSPISAPALLGHGVEAALRINSVLETRGGYLVEPFSFMGVGWTRFAAVGGDPTAHHVLIVPVGVGLAVGRGGLMIDARLAYRPVLAGGELVAIGGGRAQLQSWSA